MRSGLRWTRCQQTRYWLPRPLAAGSVAMASRRWPIWQTIGPERWTNRHAQPQRDAPRSRRHLGAGKPQPQRAHLL